MPAAPKRFGQPFNPVWPRNHRFSRRKLRSASFRRENDYKSLTGGFCIADSKQANNEKPGSKARLIANIS